LQLVPKLPEEGFEMGIVHPNGGDSVPAFCDVYLYILDLV
jgi:hypothetical protein